MNKRKQSNFCIKIANSESHIEFLTKSLEDKFIPKSFKLKNLLPGNSTANQERLDKVSFESITDEKNKHENVLKAAQAQFEISKLKIRKVFGAEAADKELERVNEHLSKVTKKLKERKSKKTIRDTEKQKESAPVTENEIRSKRKRRFKRKYLQPQPKRTRRRRRRQTILQTSSDTENEGWNGVIKNISGEEVIEDERSLLSKGQKFSPVELDPPIIRMQRELNRFFRLLRIKWTFLGKADTRSEMEKKFYETSF